MIKIEVNIKLKFLIVQVIIAFFEKHIELLAKIGHFSY